MEFVRCIEKKRQDLEMGHCSRESTKLVLNPTCKRCLSGRRRGREGREGVQGADGDGWPGQLDQKISHSLSGAQHTSSFSFLSSPIQVLFANSSHRIISQVSVKQMSHLQRGIGSPRLLYPDILAGLSLMRVATLSNCKKTSYFQIFKFPQKNSSL